MNPPVPKPRRLKPPQPPPRASTCPPVRFRAEPTPPEEPTVIATDVEPDADYSLALNALLTIRRRKRDGSVELDEDGYAVIEPLDEIARCVKRIIKVEEELFGHRIREPTMHRGAEWTFEGVPGGETLVSEIAEASAEMRPRPIIFFEDCQSSSEAFISPSTLSTTEILMKTRPIWYIPKANRCNANRMLRNAEPGCFIIRESSTPQYLAISVRQPEGTDELVQHSLMSITKKGIGISGSSKAFGTFVEFLEHFMMTESKLGLLRIPTTIYECGSMEQLDEIAQLGKRFWLSAMSLPRGRGDGRLADDPEDPYSYKLTHYTILSQDLSKHDAAEQVYGCKIIVPPDHLRHQLPVNVDALSGELSAKQPTKRRSSVGRDRQGRYATVCGAVSEAHFASPVRFNNSNDSNSPPAKQDRAEVSPGLGGQLVRGEIRSQSVRGCSSNYSNADITQSANSSFSSGTGPKSFLKSLFSRDSQKKKRTPLADCQFFFPDSSAAINTRSKSAFEVSDPLPMVTDAYRHKQLHGSASSMTTFKPATDEARPLLRGINSTSGSRLAQHSEGSPGPSPQLSCCRQPMKPPAKQLDSNVAIPCVEELRRKRLQSTNEMLNPGSDDPDSLLRLRDAVNVDIQTALFRNAERREHRLSVPNLVAESNSEVMQTAKALREKLGRTTDGELGTINEGLITPVVRRKHFAAPYVEKENGSSANHISGERDLVCVNLPVVNLNVLSANQLLPNSLGSSSPTEPRQKESELIWRRPKAVASTSSKSLNHPAQNPNRGSHYFGSKVNPSWSAVNTELKSRQKANRSPFLQPVNKMTVGGSSAQHSGIESREYDEHLDISYDKDSSSPSVNRDDDSVSVAGTVFNEPWDSNVLDNLLDLAHHGDEGIGMHFKLNDTIVEAEEDSESDHTPCSTQLTDSEDENRFDGGSPRLLQSDRIRTKAWETSDSNSRMSTLDSRLNCSLNGSLKQIDITQNSIMSLPRAVSRVSHAAQMLHSESLDDLSTAIPRLSPSLLNQNKKNSEAEPGSNIQHYVEHLAATDKYLLGQSIIGFIQCTKQSTEIDRDPNLVIRNVRQFLNGMRNYLIKHGEGDLRQVIEYERGLLGADQILSINTILEVVLFKLVLKHLKTHLYRLMLREINENDSLKMVSENVFKLRSVSLKDLGFSNSERLVIPTVSVMEQVKACLRKMQNHYSPLKKLEYLLRAIALIMISQKKDGEDTAELLSRPPPAEDLVRWLVYILARTSTVTCEIEAWYMWELLPNNMLTQGDASYYLTALYSAVHVLKSPDAVQRLVESNASGVANTDVSQRLSTAADAFLRVAIPDVDRGSIRYVTFPGVPQMNASKLCRVIAHQQGITNPEDYGLYIVMNGSESQMQPNDCPDVVRSRIRRDGKSFLIAYKRHDAQIAWPSQVVPPSLFVC